MTYLDYVVQFNRIRRHQPLPSSAADLYHHLLWVANGLGWKSTFTEGSAILEATLGMTDKTLASAREKLVQAGLLRYTPGKKGTYPSYELLTLPENAPENLRNNRGQSGGENGGNRGSNPGAKRGGHSALHKIKKEANASGAGGSALPASSPTIPPTSSPAPTTHRPLAQPSPEPEPWLAWVLATAPRVQQMKTPLTGAQWAKLVADFGEALVQEVLAAMENHADLLKKYTSANLTAREWCRRRLPAGQPVRPAPDASATPAAPEPNAEFLAQQTAAAAARRRAHLDKYATA